MIACAGWRSNSTSAGTCCGSVGRCAKPAVTRARRRCARPTRSRATWARNGRRRRRRRCVDVVVIGGGHNGLVAAGYLARAGLRVRLLERLGHIGGAAVSAQAFDGVEVRVSRYSYLVSLLPSRIVDDLGAAVRLARRQFSSYTPDPATAGRSGLLVGRSPATRSPRSAPPATSADSPTFYRRCRLVTERLWPTLLEPLRTREQARRHVLDGGDPDAAAAWRAMIDEPIGHAIADAVRNDLVRGVIATDALIGTFARLDDPSLRQNICFLYHVLGGGTGDWDVPIGGMGSVTAALAAAAVRHGAEITTGADVYAVEPDGQVRYRTRRRRAPDPGPVRPGRRHTGGPGRPARRTAGAAGAGRAGQGEHGAAAAAPVARRRRHTRTGIRRDVPRQRDVDPTGYGLLAGGRRAATGSAAVRGLLPFADRPEHPVGRAARLGRSDDDGVRLAHPALAVR